MQSRNVIKPTNDVTVSWRRRGVNVVMNCIILVLVYLHLSSAPRFPIDYTNSTPSPIIPVFGSSPTTPYITSYVFYAPRQALRRTRADRRIL